MRTWRTLGKRSSTQSRTCGKRSLTGTPLENKIEELYSIVQFVDDRQLGPAFQFLHDHRVLDEIGHFVEDVAAEVRAPVFLVACQPRGLALGASQDERAALGAHGSPI